MSGPVLGARVGGQIAQGSGCLATLTTIEIDVTYEGTFRQASMGSLAVLCACLSSHGEHWGCSTIISPAMNQRAE